MKITIVYDNEVYKKGIGLKSDWGFSSLIKTKYDTILFDTGTNGELLLHNMNKLKINPREISKIVISHEHSDHKGGLKSLIPFLEYVELFHLSHNVSTNKIMSVIPEKPKKISENVWTTGRIKGIVDEQSLVLKGEEGWYVITGCSHPGLEKILPIAKKIGKVIGIIGGFHSFNNFKLIENLNFICPCHCTEHKREIKYLYPQLYTECGVGKIFEI
jgi:7,8-dihydropterin-6-yl-methyl-4-(beta-D-ribofuranosyl)aminobenzene 5'-phosphate synthase